MPKPKNLKWELSKAQAKAGIKPEIALAERAVRSKSKDKGSKPTENSSVELTTDESAVADLEALVKQSKDAKVHQRLKSLRSSLKKARGAHLASVASKLKKLKENVDELPDSAKKNRMKAVRRAEAELSAIKDDLTVDSVLVKILDADKKVHSSSAQKGNDKNAASERALRVVTQHPQVKLALEKYRQVEKTSTSVQDMPKLEVKQSKKSKNQTGDDTNNNRGANEPEDAGEAAFAARKSMKRTIRDSEQQAGKPTQASESKRARTERADRKVTTRSGGRDQAGTKLAKDNDEKKVRGKVQQMHPSWQAKTAMRAKEAAAASATYQGTKITFD
eukprot:Clim_evm42s231 gene=Clim_evmTU42s231